MFSVWIFDEVMFCSVSEIYYELLHEVCFLLITACCIIPITHLILEIVCAYASYEMFNAFMPSFY